MAYAMTLPNDLGPMEPETLDEIRRKQALARTMIDEGTSYAPVQHWTQALARVANAMVGSAHADSARKDMRAQDRSAAEAMMGLYRPNPTAAPAPMQPSATGGPQVRMAPQNTLAQGMLGMPTDKTKALVAADAANAVDTQNGAANFAALTRTMMGNTDPQAPAAIRYNNPGAMYPGPSAQKFGSTGTETIGGGHKIAVFPDAVKGAAAQFDLLANKYAGMPLSAAITKWSGGNSSPAYIQNVVRATGLAPDTVLSPELLSNPEVAVPLAKAMSQVEAGRAYPLDDQQWASAHRMALGGPQQAAPVQIADASGQFVDANTLRQLLTNPQTQDVGQKIIMNQLNQQMEASRPLTAEQQAEIDLKKAQTEALRSKAGAPPKMSPTELKEMWSSEDQLGTIDNTISMLQRALELNDQAYTSIAGRYGSSLANNLGLASDSTRATGELDNILNAQSIARMSEQLKGATTDREMQKFIELGGSSSMDPQLRRRIIENALQGLQAAKTRNVSRVQQIRDRNYSPNASTGVQGGTYSYNPATGELEAQ